MHALDRPDRAVTGLRKMPRLCSLALLTTLGAWTPGASAAVTKVTLTPTVKAYSGDCPAQIVFKGTISVNAPGIVSYVFTRSDGATDTQTKKLKFLAAGSKAISTTWTLGGSALPQFQGWQAAKILGTAIESAHADFSVSCDPPANSAKAAHGNTDWHIDTANEFLFGKDMANHSTAANFAPAAWSKTHIHVGQNNTAHFYEDKTKVAGGEDADASNGIDKPMLFFYAGHGNPVLWNTLGNNGEESKLRIGDISNGGQLRYYWQCSCEVFAHGPKVCNGSDCDYSAPENFDGSADSDTMRNVFERWGPAIGNDLRMACGVSTLAYCHEGNVNAIWNNFNNKHMSVADAFITGLGSDTSNAVKPLCITRGGADITKTPLYDTSFTNRRNSSGTSHLHILYAGGTQTDHPVIKWTPEMIPLKLLRVRFVPPGDPVEFQRRLTRVRLIEQIRDAQIAGGAATVERNAESGTLQLRAVGTRVLVLPREAITEQVQRQNALSFARKLGWVGDDAGIIRSQKLLTASMPVGARGADITRGEKGTVVTITRRVRNGNQMLDVLGQGGRIEVVLGRDGKVNAATRTWRQAETGSEEVAIKPYAQALREAQSQMQKPDAYKLADWRFGYRENAANVEQHELAAIFEFDFVAKNAENLIDFPPQRVEILAEAK